ncbi:hypothetical protein TNCV_3230551 [Trichonephila clavipes]|nr:hypothetical protein TNCV_3230551 [Trichonephila clavipes]
MMRTKCVLLCNQWLPIPSHQVQRPHIDIESNQATSVLLGASSHDTSRSTGTNQIDDTLGLVLSFGILMSFNTEDLQTGDVYWNDASQ